MDVKTLIIILVVYFVALLICCFFVGPINKAKRKYGRKEFLYAAQLKLLMGVHPIKYEPCMVVCLRSRLVFETDEYEISIDNDKLTDIYIRTNPEEKEYYDDVAGAIAGAEAGGAIGAIIGGVGVRKVRDREDYLIVKYLSDGKVCRMTCDVTRKIGTAEEIVRKYKWLRKKNKKENKRKAKEAKNKQKIRIDM